MDSDNSTQWYDPVGPRRNGTVQYPYSLSFWMNGVVSLTVVIIGMVGNISIMVSFHCCGDIEMKRRRRQAFYYYLMTFAMWNTGVLFATILFNCLPTLLTRSVATGDVTAEISHLSNVFYLIGYWIGNCCVTADVWLAVAVTIERYSAIARPLRSRLTSPRKRARLICIILSITAIAYNLPLAFELTFTVPATSSHSSDGHISSDGRNGTAETAVLMEDTQKNKLCLSPMRDNIYYQFLYRVMGNMIFVSLVPFLIILLLTVKIVLVVRESERCRGQLRRHMTRNDSAASVFSTPSSRSATASGHRYVHILLTLIAVKFLLFYTLPVVINIVELTADPRIFESEDSEPAKVLLFLVDMANLLIVIDGATNSFFYFSWRSRVKTYQLAGRRDLNGIAVESKCLVGGHAGPPISEVMASRNQPGLKIERCSWVGRKCGQQTHLRLPQSLNRLNHWIPLSNLEALSE